MRNENARLPTQYSATIAEKLASTEERTAVIWSLQESRDPNVNLVQVTRGEGVGEHVNDEVDVLLVGVSGSGDVRINGTLHCYSSGTLILIPKEGRPALDSRYLCKLRVSDGPPTMLSDEDSCTKTRSKVSNEKRHGLHAHTDGW